MILGELGIASFMRKRVSVGVPEISQNFFKGTWLCPYSDPMLQGVNRP